MKKIIILFFLIFTFNYSANAIPWSDPNREMEIGPGDATANISFTYNVGDGASNPSILVNTSKTFEITKDVAIQGDNLTIGDGTATDKRFTVDRGGSNPFLEWDESAGAWVFSNDGTLKQEIASGAAVDEISALSNYGLDDSVGASALTINLVLKDGTTTPSADKVSIAFRSSTIANGGYVIQEVTAALSIVVPSGATLGTVNAVENDIYVYALDNAGTVELAVSLTPILDESISYPPRGKSKSSAPVSITTHWQSFPPSLSVIGRTSKLPVAVKVPD